MENITNIELTTVIVFYYLSAHTTLLNLTNVVIILFYVKAKTFSNAIFLVLSITDFFVGLISIPGEIVLEFYENWPLGKALCIFYKVFDYSSSNLSLFLLLIITAHRYLQLNDPFKHKEEMNRFRWVLIGSAWLSSYIIWFLIWYFYFLNDDIVLECYFNELNIVLYVIQCSIMIIPYIIILILNVFMIRSFYIRRKKSLELKRNFKKEQKAIYCVLSITLNLIFCWSIFLITWPIQKICINCVPEVLYKIGYVNSYLFSGLNPIILLYFNSNYRAVLIKKAACFKVFKCNK